MLIIADKRIPQQAKENLLKYGKLVLLETTGITEESISGHPDVFICETENKIIISPNLPDKIKRKFSENKISFNEGEKPVGIDYPEAAHYNAVVKDNCIIHRNDITDLQIINECRGFKRINVNQGFTRCSLLPLGNNNFITSDEGIYKILLQEKFNALKVSTEGIILPGHKYGFFGGTCGFHNNKVFILGNIKHYYDGEKVKEFLKSLNLEIVELYDGPLFDGGGIFFLDNSKKFKKRNN